MKCPICESECQERPNTATYFHEGKSWVYEYTQFACYLHYPHRWQTEEQINAALDEIDKIKKAAEKLKKAQP
jgi:hypothetical protein